MAATFGLISEGITDQIVIENILVGYYNSKNIIIDMLQPLRDETDENLAASDGNWHKVFEYCKSKQFRDAFSVREDYYVIIQLDTDFLFTEHYSKEDYPIKTHDASNVRLKVEELSQSVATFFIELIGEVFYEKHKEQIIFAISVDSLECWLLPIYFTDNKKKKTTNCLATLNTALVKNHKFSINEKNPAYYRTASKPYQKQKFLLKKYKDNPSLHFFIDALSSRAIIVEDEEEDW